MGLFISLRWHKATTIAANKLQYQKENTYFTCRFIVMINIAPKMLSGKYKEVFKDVKIQSVNEEPTNYIFRENP